MYNTMDTCNMDIDASFLDHCALSALPSDANSTRLTKQLKLKLLIILTL